MAGKETDVSITDTNHRLAVVARIGALRDGLLVLATCAYIAGYVSWMLYALKHDLGLIPALDSQFFAAGILPIILVVIFYYSARFLFYVRHWLKKEVTKTQHRIGLILIFTGLAAMVIAPTLERVVREPYTTLTTPLPFAGLIAFYVGICFARGGVIERFMQLYSLFVAWTFVVVGVLYVLIKYYDEWFPMMPQELGGPRPKCVQLDLHTSRLSAETRARLLGPSDLKSVHRSQSLHLVFAGSEFAVLMDPSSSNVDKSAFRVRTSAIEAMISCESPDD